MSRRRASWRRSPMCAVLLSGSSSQKVQTTLRLPKRLYQQVNCFVEENRADSINEFIVAAVAAILKTNSKKNINTRAFPHFKATDHTKKTPLILPRLSSVEPQ